MKFCFKICFLFLILFSPLFANQNLKKVTLQLSWFNQFQFAGYYMAKEKGYYRDAGLDVTILPFEFGIDGVEEVSSGKVDFSIEKETLMLEKARGKKIVALYALFQTSPLVLLSTKKSGIKSLKDFTHKTIMTTINDKNQVSIEAMITSAKVNLDDIKFIKHTHNIKDLVNKKTDIISAYVSKSPFELQQMGVKYNIFNPKDYGFDMYSDFLFTNENLITYNPKAVDAFTKASLKGWEYAYAHIGESVDLILKAYNTQKLSKNALLFEAKELKSLSYYNNTILGNIKKEKLQRIYDLYNAMGFIKNKIDIKSFFYNKSFSLTSFEKQYLKTKKEINFCVAPDWMPLEGIKNGKFIGMSAKYLDILQKKLNVPFTLIPTTSWSESLQYAKQRKCDILTLAIENKKRKKYMYFATPYLSVTYVIATRNSESFISDIKDILDKKIGIIKGGAYGKSLKLKYPNNIFKEVANTKEGLAKVENGYLFGFVDTLPTISYQIQKKYINNLKISGQIGTTIKLGVAIRNDEPELLAILERAIQSIDEKQKKQILNNLVSIKYEKRFNYTLFWQILLFIGIIAIFGIIRLRAIAKYNKKLNKNFEIIDNYVLLSRTDINGVITYASEALCKISGYTKEELLNKPQNIFRHPDTKKETFKNLWKTIKSGKNWQGEIQNLKKDGSSYWADTLISPIFDKYGEIEGYSGLRYDITDKKLVEKLSITDQLTQISNRLFLDTSYEKEVARLKRYNHTLSIIIIDIDHFKNVNDTFGHQIGDKVLIQIAKLFKENIRSTDILGRWGGEEFLIICPNTRKNESKELAHKLRIIIEQFDFDTAGHITCSFGVTEQLLKDATNDAIKRADDALYKAKESRNIVVAR